MLGKNISLSWQVSVMYRKPVRNTEPVTAETSQREQSVCGSTINNKALWNLWRFSTKAWSSLLRSRISFNYCTLGYSFKMLLQWKFLSLREGNAALCYHFPSLLQASAHSECAWGRADPQCLSFQVLFFSLFSLTAFRKKKNYLGQGFLFFFLSLSFLFWQWVRPFAFTMPCYLKTNIIEIHRCSLLVAMPS